MKKRLLLRIENANGPRQSGGHDYVKISGSLNEGPAFSFTVQRSSLALALDREAHPQTVEAVLTDLKESEHENYTPEENIVRL